MKTILVPTDFSETAEVALLCAIHIARQQNAELLLLHAYQPTASGYNMPYDVMAASIRDKASQARTNMKALCRLLERERVPYDCAVKEGSPVRCILKLATEHNVGMIVMGTSGESGKLSFLFGSTTTGVIESAPCPVLAIPASTPVNKPVSKVTYATDLLQSDFAAIRSLVQLAKPVNAEINILHVCEDCVNADREVNRLHVFMKQLEEQVKYPRFTCELLVGDSASEELLDYVNAGHTDALVLSTAYRNLLGRLFAESVTKQLALSSPVPVVAFHHRDQHPIRIYT